VRELHQLEKNIASFLKKFYFSNLLRGLLLGFGSLLFLLSVIVSAEYLLYLSGTMRAVLFYGYMLSSLLVIAYLIMRPILQYLSLIKGISLEEAAHIIGEKVPDVGDKLTNTLELKGLLASHSDGLLEAGIQQKAVRLSPVDFKQAVKLSENRKYLKYLFLPLALSVLVIIVWPNAWNEGAKRLVSYSTEFEKPAPFRFVLDDVTPQTTALRDFELSFSIDGEYIPSDVFIVFNDKKFLVPRKADHFMFLFKNPTRDIEFFLSADGYDSRLYTLKVLNEPKIKYVRLDLDFPSHVGLTDKQVDYNGVMSLPYGTKINWTVGVESVDQLNVAGPDSSIQLVASSKTTTSFQSTILKTELFTLQAINDQGFDSDPFVLEFKVVEDEFPEIEANWYPDTLSFRNFYFNGSLSDDYGLSRLLFEYSLKGEKWSDQIMISPDLPVQEFYHNFSFDSIAPEPGEAISFRFIVFDNDRVRGPKASYSRSFSLTIPDPSSLRKKEEEENEASIDKLTAGIDEAKKLQAEMKKLQEQLLNKKKLEWTDKEALQKLLEKQKELQQQMNELSKQQESQRERRQNLSPQDEKLIEKQKQIEELMKNLENDRLQKLLEEMEKSMEDLKKDQAQEKLDDLQKANEELEKEMDRTLELLKQLEFEQKLEQNIQALEELKKDQDNLSDKNKPSPDEQDKLNERFESLKENLKDMVEKNEELERPNQLPKDIEEKAENIQMDMKDSKESLSSGDQKKAKQSQKSASEQMEEMKDDLSALQKMMQEEKPAEDLEALRRLLENLIQLSFDQEALIDEVGETSFNDPAFRTLTQEQKKLKDDSKVVEDSLFALSKRVAELAPTVNKEMSAITENLEKSIKAMTDLDIRNTQTRQQYVMTSLNNLALILDESIQNAQQDMSQQKFGNQSCSKPGQGKKPSASEMKKKQQALQQAMEELMKKMEQGKGQGEDGKKSGGQGSEMSKELSKLAAEQSAIREQIRKLYESLNKGGKDAGENLRKIEELMEENEKDLINRDLSIETINRQEEIITRLLESEKAEREQEYDKKRESQEGNYSEERNIFDLEEYKKLKQKESELLRSIPPDLSPYYKKKVSEYLFK